MPDLSFLLDAVNSAVKYLDLSEDSDNPARNSTPTAEAAPVEETRAVMAAGASAGLGGGGGGALAVGALAVAVPEPAAQQPTTPITAQMSSPVMAPVRVAISKGATAGASGPDVGVQADGSKLVVGHDIQVFSSASANRVAEAVAPSQKARSAWFQWMALFGGILIQPFFQAYQASANHQWSFDGFGGWTLFALITSVVIFPGVYKRAFDQDSPVLVQLAPIFTAGLGWQSLLTTAIKLVAKT
jgi:hypothetical protein